jgi:hypothetical protein
VHGGGSLYHQAQALRAVGGIVGMALGSERHGKAQQEQEGGEDRDALYECHRKYFIVFKMLLFDFHDKGVFLNPPHS